MTNGVTECVNEQDRGRRSSRMRRCLCCAARSRSSDAYAGVGVDGDNVTHDLELSPNVLLDTETRKVVEIPLDGPESAEVLVRSYFLTWETELSDARRRAMRELSRMLRTSIHSARAQGLKRLLWGETRTAGTFTFGPMEDVQV